MLGMCDTFRISNMPDSFLLYKLHSSKRIECCKIAEWSTRRSRVAHKWSIARLCQNSQIASCPLQVPFRRGTVFALTKQYWAMWQYSHFVRAGHTILKVEQPESVLVALSPGPPDSRSATVVLTNPQVCRFVFEHDVSWALFLLWHRNVWIRNPGSAAFLEPVAYGNIRRSKV